MADQNLRDVLHTTSRLRQQLLQAVDRLENRGQDRPLPAAANHQSSSTSGAGSNFDALNRVSVPSGNPRVPTTGASNIGLGAPSASQRVPITYSGPSSLGLHIPSSSTSAYSVSPSFPVHHPSSGSADPSRGSLLWGVRGSLQGKRKSTYKKGGSKKKKLPTWSHTFVCLANKEQDTIPDRQERASLILAGLGEKKITFDEYCSHQEINSELIFQYPKLAGAGGFELLRVPEGGGKALQEIATPQSGYAIPYLRAVVHHAIVYVRPLQRNLNTDEEPSVSTGNPPKETCVECGEMVSVSALKEHLVRCKRSSHSSHGRPEGAEDILSPVESPPPVSWHRNREHSPSPVSWLKEQKQSPPPGSWSIDQESRIDLTTPSPENESNNGVGNTGCDVQDTEEALIQAALELSKKNVKQSSTVDPTPENLASIIHSLQQKYLTPNETFTMPVRRYHLLSDAFKRMARPHFSPSKELIVQFVGEDGTDTGGLTREFFSWFGVAMHQRYMSPTGCFLHNSMAFQDGVYSRIGQLTAMSLVHGGGAINVFCPAVYSYMCGMSPSDIIVSSDEVPDKRIRDFLEKVQSAGDNNELQSIITEEENIDLLIRCGYTKPVFNVITTDIVDIVQIVALQNVILDSLGELSQFCDGLSCLGVRETLCEHKDLMRSFFCTDSKKPLEADHIRELFEVVQYSSSGPGTNAHTRETNAYMMFLDYLYECEKAKPTESVIDEDIEEEACGSMAAEQSGSTSAEPGISVSLGQVLNFFSGAYSIPPCGYPGKKPTLNFNEDNVFPTASTCAIMLTLPTKYENYETFKRQLDIAFTMHGGFGKS